MKVTPDVGLTDWEKVNQKRINKMSPDVEENRGRVCVHYKVIHFTII